MVWMEQDYTLFKISFQVQKVKKQEREPFQQILEMKQKLHGLVSFQVQKVKKQEREIFQELIYSEQGQTLLKISVQVQKVKKQEREIFQELV